MKPKKELNKTNGEPMEPDAPQRRSFDREIRLCTRRGDQAQETARNGPMSSPVRTERATAAAAARHEDTHAARTAHTMSTTDTVVAHGIDILVSANLPKR